MDAVAEAFEHAIAGLVDAVAGVAPAWLVLGVVFHLLNQVARGIGWHAVVEAACEDGTAPRKRHSVAAWVAGAGAGGVVSARGGDAVRVLVLNRRTPEAGGALLTGTLVAECVGETAIGGALLAFGLAVGLGPSFGLSTSTLFYVPAVLLVAVGAYLLARRSVRVRRFLAKAAHGCALLRCPKAYSRQVLPWQLLSRVLRLVALGCFLAAFGLPATPAAVLLVVFAQSSGRLVPFSPASVGAGAAILAATFGPITGDTVSASHVAAFFVGTSTVLTVIGTVLALVICAQASAKAGPNPLTVLGRLMRMRPATAPRP
ncbi:flippase-like domain-containing protein [Solirubrobacter ginsenosidimutans]|uniref:Flippase-like domain-containing protein n=1 Tax=Solirubrobacter ginsenosidimutans TaxID=490573 RepID=A0A9X3MP04_9ACTN|nr:lysylphosphatidylglycerol synthase transmembrane domain-containing protein [Solirubrobacter ginsenosidimutans]MDA0159729.1 flippase-like domain-containing protein [Solirubrobacter ginsenosidimutans]